MAGSVHFFDIASAAQGSLQAWSPNTFRTRLVLNFKRIPYSQSFVSYPDIAPLLQSLGVPPLENQALPYTLPAIVDSSTGTRHALNDSLPIALHLDAAFPAPAHPPLFPTSASYPLAVAVLELITAVTIKQIPILMPKVPAYLDPRGQEYFLRTRAERFGKPLAEVAAHGAELERVWHDVSGGLARLATMLRGVPGQSKTGPFFEGNTPGYADFLVVAFLAFYARINQDDWEKVMAVGNGEFRSLWNACLPWVEGQGQDVEWKTASA
ncbi:hypothetical protein LOZ36_006436 [Ophidiomyces ophidiicola]|nr:hypothetical protein LOZ36_006436 [Ophidiomyces ophidiicola]